MPDFSDHAIVARHQRAIKRVLSAHPEWIFDPDQFGNQFRDALKMEYARDLIREIQAEDIEE